MAWAHRTSGRYYYRSVRHGRRVTKTYHGTGLFGELAAELDAEERAERQAKAEAWLQARIDMGDIDAQVTAYLDLSQDVIDTTLTLQGYHRHDRGPWRKRRAHHGTQEASHESG